MKKTLQKVWDEIKASPVSVIIVLACVAVLVFIPLLVKSDTNTTTNKHDLYETIDKCDKQKNLFTLTDDNTVIIGDFSDSKIDSGALSCVYDELEIPERIQSFINKTASIQTLNPTAYSDTTGQLSIKWVTYPSKNGGTRTYLQILSL